jgi:hypothetical protein
MQGPQGDHGTSMFPISSSANATGMHPVACSCCRGAPLVCSRTTDSRTTDSRNRPHPNRAPARSPRRKPDASSRQQPQSGSKLQYSRFARQVVVLIRFIHRSPSLLTGRSNNDTARQRTVLMMTSTNHANFGRPFASSYFKNPRLKPQRAAAPLDAVPLEGIGFCRRDARQHTAKL